jgi:hypothetical protein
MTAPTPFADGAPAVSCPPPDPDELDRDLGFHEVDERQASQASPDSPAEALAAAFRWLAEPDTRPYVGSGKRSLRFSGAKLFSAAWAVDPRIIGDDAPTLSKLEKELDISRQALSALAKDFTQHFGFLSAQQLGARAVETCRKRATDRWERRHALLAEATLRALNKSGGFTAPWISWPRFMAAGGVPLWRPAAQSVTWEQRGKGRMAVWICAKELQNFLQKLAAEGQTEKDVR